MWLGLTLTQGFRSGSVAVGFSRRKRSQGVSSETSVASYSWTAIPKKSEKLYWMSAYSSSLQLWSSHSPSFLSTSVFDPSAFTRMSFLDFHHCS